MSDYGVSPVRGAYWAELPPGMSDDEKIRYMLRSSATVLTDEQMAEIEQDAPWIKIHDDGIEYSRGMVELLTRMGADDQKRLLQEEA